MRRLLAVLLVLAACAYLYATEPSAEGQTSDASEAPCPDTGQDGYDLDPCPQPPRRSPQQEIIPFLPVCLASSRSVTRPNLSRSTTETPPTHSTDWGQRRLLLEVQCGEGPR